MFSHAGRSISKKPLFLQGVFFPRQITWVGNIYMPRAL